MVSRQSCPSNHAELERKHVCKPVDIGCVDSHAMPVRVESKKRVKPAAKHVCAVAMSPRRDTRGIKPRDVYAGLMAG
jgi:hypothetical protein